MLLAFANCRLVFTWVFEVVVLLTSTLAEDVVTSDEADKDSNLAFVAFAVACLFSLSFWKNLPTKAFCCSSRSLLTLKSKKVRVKSSTAYRN